jgi:hypothetical protein
VGLVGTLLALTGGLLLIADSPRRRQTRG